MPINRLLVLTIFFAGVFVLMPSSVFAGHIGPPTVTESHIPAGNPDETSIVIYQANVTIAGHPIDFTAYRIWIDEDGAPGYETFVFCVANPCSLFPRGPYPAGRIVNYYAVVRDLAVPPSLASSLPAAQFEVILQAPGLDSPASGAVVPTATPLLDWFPVVGATWGYRAEVIGQGEIAVVVGDSVTVPALMGLVPGPTYTWRVRACTDISCLAPTHTWSVTRTFTVAGGVNVAPDVTIDTPDGTIVILPPGTLSLNATVTDDNLPDPPDNVVLTWSAIGPAPVTFSDPSIEDPVATFTVIGLYNLELNAEDSALNTSKFVNIFVSAVDITPPDITSISSVGGDVASPWVTSDTTPDVAFATDEPAWCRIDVSDLSYTAMGAGNDCAVGQGALGHLCTSATVFLIGPGQNLYIACRDVVPNEESSVQNEDITFEITGGPDIFPPVIVSISSVGGDVASPWVTSDTTPDVAFATDEPAWCRMGPTDLGYDAMSPADDCAVGQGALGHLCTSATVFPSGPGQNLHIACRDVVPNPQSDSQNEDITFEVTVAGAAPTLDVLSHSPDPVGEGDMVTYSATFSDPDGVDLIIIGINVGGLGVATKICSIASGDLTGLTTETCSLTHGPYLEGDVVIYEALATDLLGNTSIAFSNTFTVGPVGGGGGIITFTNPISATSFSGLIDTFTNFLFTLAVIIAPVLLVVAGVIFMTAAGDPGRVSMARRMLIWTIVGFAIILLSKGLVSVLGGILGI